MRTDASPYHVLASIAAERIDAAILDVNIAGRNTLDVADELSRRRTPFAFASGNKTPASITRHAPARLITKPYAAETIYRVLCDLLSAEV